MIPELDEFGFQWHITDRCNRRCRHCYQDDFDAAREPGIDSLIELADHIFTSLAPVPVTINLTGGEPFLVPEFTRFVNHLCSQRNLEELNIITNATIADEKLIEDLSRFPKLTAFKVSIESHVAEINDHIRGRGHLELVTTNIERLRKAKPVILMVTLCKYNRDSVEGLCRFAREHLVDGIIFERYVPLGSGAALVNQVLDSRDWTSVVDSICRETHVDVSSTELMPYKAFLVDTSSSGDPYRERLRGALCNLGPLSMALMPDGTVYPCRRLPVRVGHFPTQSMNTILTALSAYASNELSARMNGPKCGMCDFTDECAGCRALTMALGGTLYDDDIQCAWKENTST